MSTIAAPAARAYTPDNLLSMADGKSFELVDGHLVRRRASVLSSWVGANLAGLLWGHCKPDNLAWVFGAGCGHRCFPGHPQRIRRVAASCVLRGRMPRAMLDDDFVTVAPDIAVEVLSPEDRAYPADQKVHEYLDARTRLVWVVLPPSQTICVYRADGSGTLLRESGKLDGEDVLPGFHCRVGDLFPKA